MFQSMTHGQLDLKEIPIKLKNFYDRNRAYETPFQIIIGTDSQNFPNETKIVTVVSIICEGHGGIFFYKIDHNDRISDVRTKLHLETNDSLEIATDLVGYLEEDPRFEEMYLNCPICIHVDAGNSTKGKTYMLIPELVGWVKACGYDAKTKPDSFVASTIADRISK